MQHGFLPPVLHCWPAGGTVDAAPSKGVSHAESRFESWAGHCLRYPIGEAVFFRRGGDMLIAQVDALVNPVNTVGVMGKGLALQVKRAFPPVYSAYRSACLRGELRLGEMQVCRTEREQPRFVVNFPTKGHWRDKSVLHWIEAGLEDLVRVVHGFGIASIAVPALGCGLGGLGWADVYPLILASAEQSPETEWWVYLPK